MTNSNRNDVKRRRRFFYAEGDSDLYDQTIGLVVPMYKPMHRVVADVAEMYCDDRDWRQVNILDVGSGTGGAALGILKRLPSAYLVGLDLSEPMNVRLQSRLSRTHNRAVTTMTGDICSPKLTPEDLLNALPESRRSTGYHLVISCFTVHHLTHREKRAAIEKIFAILAPGGVFILGDLFSFQSPLLAETALQHDLDWIRKHFEAESLRCRSAVMRARLKSLERRWLAHYVRDNLTEPLDQDPSRPGSSISTMLQDAGYINVQSPFRFWQVGVVVAERPLRRRRLRIARPGS